MLRNLSPAHIMIVVIALVVLFGWKRLPDMARSLGRSARVFKSEVDEMRNDGRASGGGAPSSVSPGSHVTPVSPGGPAGLAFGDDVTDPQEQARRDAEARLAEAEAKLAEARSEAERLRGESRL
jgi:sec-independent protein translocase protein TatA